MSSRSPKPVDWIGSSYKDFRTFPDDVQDHMGYALHLAQIGRKHGSAKPLRGFGSAGIVELVSDHVGDTYRAVYTVKFDTAVYVLHAFQKKSKSGIKTPTTDLAMIERRLKLAEVDHQARRDEGEIS
jgi:phage-related protein